MKEKFKQMDYEQLINFVRDNDAYSECYDEQEFLDYIIDRLQHGFYEQAKELIDILQKQRYHFDDGFNYRKNDCGTFIPLLTEEDVLDNFDYLFE